MDCLTLRTLCTGSSQRDDVPAESLSTAPKPLPANGIDLFCNEVDDAAVGVQGARVRESLFLAEPNVASVISSGSPWNLPLCVRRQNRDRAGEET
jgi:hypothetical protein